MIHLIKDFKSFFLSLNPSHQHAFQQVEGWLVSGGHVDDWIVSDMYEQHLIDCQDAFLLYHVAVSDG